MSKAHAELPTPGPGRSVLYLDAEGNPTDDPALAVRGAVIEYDERGRPTKRAWFLLDEGEIEWLPVSEPAFLLWVLAALVGIWIVIAVVIQFVL
jgi:hypothetical protein